MVNHKFDGFDARENVIVLNNIPRTVELFVMKCECGWESEQKPAIDFVFKKDSVEILEEHLAEAIRHEEP